MTGCECSCFLRHQDALGKGVVGVFVGIGCWHCGAGIGNELAMSVRDVQCSMAAGIGVLAIAIFVAAGESHFVASMRYVDPKNDANIEPFNDRIDWIDR